MSAELAETRYFAKVNIDSKLVGERLISHQCADNHNAQECSSLFFMCLQFEKEHA